MTEEPEGTEPLIETLTALERAVAACSFSLSADDRGERQELRDRMAHEMSSIAGRVRALSSPLLVVVGGVTGSGKSTVVNTMVGRAVARTGVIRPTTSRPTLVVHPVDAHWFTDQRILPEYERIEAIDAGDDRADPDDPPALRVIRDDGLPLGLAIVDAPDIDSVSAHNRQIAEELLDAADVWLWCTTAAKYADEESMRYLARGASRRTALAVALTRVRPEHVDELLEDFRAKMIDHAGIDPELFAVPTARVVDERLPRPAIVGVDRWTRELSGPLVRRSRRRQTIEGALDALGDDARRLASWVDDELSAARALTDVINRTVAQTRHEFSNAVDAGRVVRDEAFSRWHRFAASGGVLALAERAGEHSAAWVRSLTMTGAGDRAAEEQDVRAAIAEDVVDLATQLVELAGGRIVNEWGTFPAGRALLERNPELPSVPELRSRAQTAIREWQSSVVHLVQTKGAKHRMRARWLSVVVNATATGALIATLAQATGSAGTEASVAQAAGAANQKLLSNVLGAANLRWLVTSARQDLDRRFTELVVYHRQRFVKPLAEAAPPPRYTDHLREQADEIVKVRSCLV